MKFDEKEYLSYLKDSYKHLVQEYNNILFRYELYLDLKKSLEKNDKDRMTLLLPVVFDEYSDSEIKEYLEQDINLIKGEIENVAKEVLFFMEYGFKHYLNYINDLEDHIKNLIKIYSEVSSQEKNIIIEFFIKEIERILNKIIKIKENLEKVVKDAGL